LISGDPDALIEAMREIESAAADARRELRRSIAETGFEARLQARVPRTARIVRAGTPRLLPEQVEALITDTVLEGVRDASGRFTLTYLEYADALVRVRVQREAPTGQVSAALCERARAVGGRLEVVAGEDGLVVLRLDIPTPG
jgi:endonuclease III